MKTNAITKGAMCTALYGLLLLLDTQTGLLMESMMNWIFILPILFYTAKEGVYPGFITAVAMGILTFMFGGFTTWFYSWTALIIGFVYGVGIFKQFKHTLNFGICFVLTVITYILMVFVWSQIFGMDLESDFAWLERWIPTLNFLAFVFIFILFMSFVQTLCVHMLAILVSNRLRIPIRSLGSLRDFHASQGFGFFSLAIALFFFFGQNVIEYSIYRSIIQVLFFCDLVALAFFGAIVLMDYGLSHRIPKFSFFAVIGAFVPILQILWILLGLFDCLFSLRQNWDGRG